MLPCTIEQAPCHSKPRLESAESRGFDPTVRGFSTDLEPKTGKFCNRCVNPAAALA